MKSGEEYILENLIIDFRKSYPLYFPQTQKTKVYKTIILPVLLYGCVMWPPWT